MFSHRSNGAPTHRARVDALSQAHAPAAQFGSRAPTVEGPIVRLRALLQRALLFPVMRFYLELQVRGLERLGDASQPVIFYYNYQGPYAPILLLRALPANRRRRLALAVDARLWQGTSRIQGTLGFLFAAAYPFSKSAAGLRASLSATLAHLDGGWSVAIAPEGQPEPGGRLLPFLDGAGFLAVRARVPLVPIRIHGFNDIFPQANRVPDALRFPYLPDKRGGRATLSFGSPFVLDAGIKRHDATERLRQAWLELDLLESGSIAG